MALAKSNSTADDEVVLEHVCHIRGANFVIVIDSRDGAWVKGGVARK